MKVFLEFFPVVGLFLSAMSLLACREGPPAACRSLCAEATSFFETCLNERGEDFSAYGYEDAADYEDACLTWAWEEQELEDAGALDMSAEEECLALEEAFQTADCSEAMGVDWTNPP